MQIHRTSRTALALVAAIGLTVGTASTSSAAVLNQTLSRSIYLADTSAAGSATLPYSDNATIAVSSSGEYLWQVYFVGALDGPSREIELAAGTYAWGCQITGLGVSGEQGNNYAVLCWLQNLTTPSDKIAYLPDNASLQWDVDLPQGTYTWDVSLQND